MSNAKKIVLSSITFLLIIILGACGYFYFRIYSMYEAGDSFIEENIPIEETKEFISKEQGDKEDIENNVLLDDKITNILLIGTDGRTVNERGRSDAMMIATIDERHKSIKLTSLARDTYVKIPGRGYEKLNHAYSYGGVNLLMKTIENNLGIGISEYINVNFTSFIDIVDILGGITLNVEDSELAELNKFIPECFEASNKKDNEALELIKNAGVQKLNGYQALSYSRIRKNDSALARDGRQRKVLQSLLEEISKMSFKDVTKTVNAVIPYVKTNIKPLDVIKYSSKVLKINNFDIKQLEFPIQEYSKGGIIKKKGWVLQFDANKCLPVLHKFIFEEYGKYEYFNNVEEKNDFKKEDVDKSDKNNKINTSPDSNINTGNKYNSSSIITKPNENQNSGSSSSNDNSNSNKDNNVNNGNNNKDDELNKDNSEDNNNESKDDNLNKGDNNDNMSNDNDNVNNDSLEIKKEN